MSFKRWLWRGLLLALGAFVLYQLWVFAHICWWINHNPSSTAFMRHSLSMLQEQDPKATLKYSWVDYRKISNHLKRALVASEDAKFTMHDGFDWAALEKTYEKNLDRGRIVGGGSTISQQLAKNLFLSSQRTPWRKGEEAIITVMLEKMMSKRRMLEIYLNVIEWGNGVFGAEAASRYYFRTSAANLSAAQAARLAAMVPNPRYYDQHRSTRYLTRRIYTIQARMPSAVIP